MDVHWCMLHRSTLEDAFCVIHWAFPMWLLWDCMGDCPLAIPWTCSLGHALGFPGLALGLVIGYSLEVLFGLVIGVPTCDSHGIAWVLLHGSTMDVPYG